MSLWKVYFSLFVVSFYKESAAYFQTKNFYCGPYGFICEGSSKLKLCNSNNLFGPSFKCPTNTLCNEDSSSVCENARNYIDPSLSKTLRCYKSERIADPTVPGCKGYILCIPNKRQFQGIKFQCTGDTIFNGFTRTCSSPSKYKCPVESTTSSLAIDDDSNRRMDSDFYGVSTGNAGTVEGKPIECKNYKFSVTDDDGPVRATYFCPNRPLYGGPVRCTVFSSKFCLTLERDDQDQFINSMGQAYRKPRT